ncbi:right-handed parallel beta-helix repeat-containing protein [Cohnella sp. WQ 127256]|uniref:right-handed parallel beta-helix repeat-containing protein n=1 Tax=Cohnella sp. WQ 127256 TaxID=2938790 RepID=UPI0021193B97|nr:right-handed parallel beta-helix repeat-containing protein [Cohnella sp. WQ 127256]
MENFTIVRLTDYGASPDTGKDATIPMRLALAEAARTEGPVLLDCPQGRYDFYPADAAKVPYYVSNTASKEENGDVTKTIGVYMTGQKNLVIEGNGSSFVYHGKMTMMVLDGCERVELRNFNADYAFPTMAEMTVERSEEGCIETVVHPDTRYAVEDGKLDWIGEGWKFRQGPMQVYDPVTDMTRRVDNWVASASQVEPLGERRLRFVGKEIPSLPPGTVLQMRDGLRDQVGTFVTGSSDVRWSNVGMFYMHGLGIICQYSTELSFDRMNLAPQEGSGRTAAAFADFIHLSGCRGKISVTNSRFVGGHDDPINVHGTHLIAVGQPSETELIVRFMHPQTYGFAAFHPEDEIEFVQPNTLVGYGVGKIVAVEPINVFDIRLKLEKSVPASFRIGDAIENVTWTPEVEIRNNDFSRIPTRGVLITTRRKVIIADNRFKRMTMSAILIADDALSWYESGRVADVVIRGNVFTECGGNEHPVIRIEPENSAVSTEMPVHRNIRIEGNRFIMNEAAALHAKSTEDLVFSGNELVLSDRIKTELPTASHIHLTACKDTEITGNEVIGGTHRLSVRLESMNRKELHGYAETEIEVTEEETTHE